MSSNFSWIDVSILITYLVTLSAVGFYFSKRQTNLKVFFLAGRNMGWIPVGLSLMACLNSGIDYLMGPSSTIRYGLILLIGMTSWLFLYPWSSRVMLPFYRRLHIYTAYEYLEQRFDGRVRSLAAAIFILWRLGWIATAMYVPCLAISAVTGGRLPLIPTIIVLGSIVTLYTLLGGVKAVIWTDVVQFFVMFGGLAVTVLVIVSNVPGGVGAIWSYAQASGKTSFLHPIAGAAGASFVQQVALFFKEPITLVGLFIATMVGRMTVYTCDQVMVQRFQTTKSVQESRQAFLINAGGDILWTVGLAFVGLSLFAYFRFHIIPSTVKPDEIFPYFMAQRFPAGILGLVIAAIFAASLGAIGSAINSCTSVIIVDFYDRLILKRAVTDERTSEADERRQVFISRLATLGIGIVAIILSSLVGHIGDLIEIANKVIQLFTGTLFGIYILGMFTQRTRSLGALIGGLVGVAVSLYVAFASPLSFTWPTVCGFLATIIVGYGTSLLLPATAHEDSQILTWRHVMQRSLLEERESAIVPAEVEVQRV
jgi:sodium-coupled monocarboxylate transporter 8/12